MLQIGHTAYVGLGGRTNAGGIRQLGDLLAPLSRITVPVPLTGVLHHKSAITALPDGSPVTWECLVGRSHFLACVSWQRHPARTCCPSPAATC